MIAAIVLAGGRSRRLGTEKAMLSFKGEPLLAVAIARLAAQGFTVAVNAPKTSGAAGWAADHGHATLSDDPADPVGPLAGIKAGLLWAHGLGATTLVTAPCDTPILADDLETQLIASLPPDAGAACARSPSGLQSLCAAWRIEPTLRALAAHFGTGKHPAVHDLLGELRAVEVAFSDDTPFANLNTWDDVRRAAP